MAPLAQLLPVLVIDPGGDDPVEGAPGARRALLDWGVFYADSGYRSAWARFQRALRQRNEALRRGGRALGAWTEEFVRLGEAVHAQRAAYAARLDTAFRTMMAEAVGLDEVRLSYRAGWRAELGLAEAVADAEAADRERGFSGVGPQRADLVVRLGDVGAAGRVSRGQGKVLKAGLRLAQNLLLKEDQETGAVVLLDDLGSELDPMRQAWVVSRLIESNSQVIATAIDGGSGFGDWAPARMFHVEHGRLRPTEQV
jgi:DNA replication and repair protein RecF